MRRIRVGIKKGGRPGGKALDACVAVEDDWRWPNEGTAQPRPQGRGRKETRETEETSKMPVLPLELSLF